MADRDALSPEWLGIEIYFEEPPSRKLRAFARQGQEIAYALGGRGEKIRQTQFHACDAKTTRGRNDIIDELFSQLSLYALPDSRRWLTHGGYVTPSGVQPGKGYVVLKVPASYPRIARTLNAMLHMHAGIWFAQSSLLKHPIHWMFHRQRETDPECPADGKHILANQVTESKEFFSPLPGRWEPCI